ncbi:hypothetical protein [Hafnia alvei]|jgi:hypothetical protein|uniref:hypothetical protein n=1 Tax=Hafnia alvei TaxID=569 RepID=UPI00062201BD|nr:hypothetical protein [Hafnia alvei]KKI47008.1 hypothetical protein XK86_00715 [Hafnia alvei]TBL89829.1 hypothetical protein EYY88_02085 [Hafnia alvei]
MMIKQERHLIARAEVTDTKNIIRSLIKAGFNITDATAACTTLCAPDDPHIIITIERNVYSVWGV